MNKKIVIFGAGKIGRSFIGQIFARNGYQVVFIDTDERIISALNKKRKYTVVIKDKKPEKIIVENVSGIMANDHNAIIEEIKTSSLLATSVGQRALKIITPLIGKAIEKRYKSSPENPLDIILAENMRDAAGFLMIQLRNQLNGRVPIDDYVGCIETSIGKMVPIMKPEEAKKDILKVFAESYNTLILDGEAFKNPIPNIAALSPKKNMKAWVDRKLFIHNFGHAAVAYKGRESFPGAWFTWEPLAAPSFREMIIQTMKQSGDILRALHPDEFSNEDISLHIHELVERFKNKALGDTLYRVGCDLQRKLGPDDRVITPMRTGIQKNMPVNLIKEVLTAALGFDPVDENGNMLESDREFIEIRNKWGNKWILENICGLEPDWIEQHLV